MSFSCPFRDPMKLQITVPAFDDFYISDIIAGK
jgi:hypothetical protein